VSQLPVIRLDLADRENCQACGESNAKIEVEHYTSCVGEEVYMNYCVSCAEAIGEFARTRGRRSERIRCHRCNKGFIGEVCCRTCEGTGWV
jgi:hypothetical protein